MKLTFKLLIGIILVTVCIVVLMTGFFWNSQNRILLQQAHIQAKTLFDMIVITRQWVAENRDEVVPVPAVVTKELSLYAGRMSDFRFHITSEQLINPENAPDNFELKALAMFREGSSEVEEIETIENKKYFRYMAPLYVNNACMECHDYQGYKIGDLRGGISVTIPLAEIEKAIAENNKNYEIIGIAAFLGIVLTVGLLLRMMVLKNISTLTRAAASYKHGDFSGKVDIRTGDEIQELSEAFEMMRQSILENEDNLKEQLAKVTSQYKSVMEKLKASNRELKSINTFKSDILDNLAHEVRTPLTKIISYSEILVDKRNECGADVRDKSLATIARSAKLLNTLFNEIITLSRLDSNQYPYHFIPVEIGQLIREITAEYDKDIQDKNITVTIDIHSNAIMCLDGESFRHVVTNLISNAVKFNRQNGFLSISMNETEDYRIIEVKDSGVGIPEDEIAKITGRFYRCSNVKREFSGTGLGLSIISKIIDGHKGRLEVTSVLGEGSVFRVMIPRCLPCSTSMEETVS